MPSIFISYRRDDSAGYAGRLFDRLKQHFGADHVFMDVAGIEIGTDFVQALDSALAKCEVLLALIGPRWFGRPDAQGRSRLHDPQDFVRIELSKALQRNIRVVPVLVGGAALPRPEQLPEELQPLLRRHATELTNERWDLDSRDLIRNLEGSKPRRRWVAVALALVAALAAGIGVWQFGFATVTVPPVVGLTLAEGAARLKAARLEPGAQQTRATPDQAEGTVLAQSPEAGASLRAGSRVDLVLATALRVTIPDLVGLTLAAARERIKSAGAAEGARTTKPSRDAAKGTVLRQSPAAGTEVKAAQARIDLVVAVPASLTVPNLIGQRVADSGRLIEAAGLTTGTRESEIAGGQEPGTIVRQSPPAGSEAAPGSAVDIVVAAAPMVGSIKINRPQLRFATQAVGRTSKPLRVLASNDGNAPVKVQTLAPSGDGDVFRVSEDGCSSTTVPAGGRCPVEIVFTPRNAGTAEAHFTLLDPGGKPLATITATGNGALPQAAAPDRSPASGGTPAGGAATASGKVPELRGKPYQDALKAADDAGLKLAVVGFDTRSTTLEPGTIVTQMIRAGETVPAGSVIDVVMASRLGAGNGPKVLFLIYSRRSNSLCYGVQDASAVTIDPDIGKVLASPRNCVAISGTRASSYQIAARDDSGKTARRGIKLPKLP